MPVTVNGLNNWKTTVIFNGPTAIVTADVTGGAIIRMQVAVFDSQGNFLQGIGSHGQGLSATSVQDGTARYNFSPNPSAAKITWGIQGIPSAGGDAPFNVTVKVRNQMGEALAVGSFSATIPPNQDEIIYDGVKVNVVSSNSMPSIPVDITATSQGIAS